MTHIGEIPHITDEEVEYEIRITNTRKNLYKTLEEARLHLTKATLYYRELGGKKTWDAEYETSGEFAKYLHEASRTLDIARGLLPTDEDGEPVQDSVESDAIRALLKDSYL